MDGLNLTIPRKRNTILTAILLQAVLVCLQQPVVLAKNDDSEESEALFGNGLGRDWLYSASAISLQVEGCIWGYTSNQNDVGCMENGSQDGTTYWYQMANCRRAQVAYKMFSSNGNSASCNSNNFKESFVTTHGLATFMEYVKDYDGNNQFDDEVSGDDARNYDDYNNDGDNGYDDLPNCEQTNNGYVGLGCTDEGKFALVYFSDSYCLNPTGKTYDSLKSLNRGLQQYKKCAGISYGQIDGDGESLPEQLIYTSQSCSSLDSGYCTDSTAMQQRRQSVSFATALRNHANISEKSWVTKLKYATGGLLLLASFVMFTGILFTNRRRRRALMQRKYRQSRSERSRKGGRSSKSRTRRSSRSKSRARDKEGEGYFT